MGSIYVYFFFEKHESCPATTGILDRLGRYPSGQRGQTVNLLRLRFEGSNPSLPISIFSGQSAAISD